MWGWFGSLEKLCKFLDHGGGGDGCEGFCVIWKVTGVLGDGERDEMVERGAILVVEISVVEVCNGCGDF